MSYYQNSTISHTIRRLSTSVSWLPDHRRLNRYVTFCMSTLFVVIRQMSETLNLLYLYLQTSFVSSNFILYLLPRGLVIILCPQNRHQTSSHFTNISYILQHFCPMESVSSGFKLY
jgi:hypothetical protein